MKRRCFSEGQVIDILKEHQAGLGAKKMKALETDNAKLKKLLGEQIMDLSTLKEMLGKNF